jgi:hypothetical protein
VYGLALPPVTNDQANIEYEVMSPEDLFTLSDAHSPTLQHVLLSTEEQTLIRQQVQTMILEIDRFRETMKEIKAKSITVAGFYHVSRWARYWREVVEEQMHILDGKRQFGNRSSFAVRARNPRDAKTEQEVLVRTLPWNEKSEGSRGWPSLLSISQFLSVNIVGPTNMDFDRVVEVVNSLPLRYSEQKIHFSFNKSTPRGFYMDSDAMNRLVLDAVEAISEGEYTTIDKLYNYCTDVVQRKRRAFVYYFHNKGGCCSRVHRKTDGADDYPSAETVDPVASWREAMNTFNLEYPSICLRALLRGHPVCGFEYQEAHYRYDDSHFVVQFVTH